MYYYGSGCSNTVNPCCYPTMNHQNNYAIILVLFILLVIILGSRMN